MLCNSDITTEKTTDYIKIVRELKFLLSLHIYMLSPYLQYLQYTYPVRYYFPVGTTTDSGCISYSFNPTVNYNFKKNHHMDSYNYYEITEWSAEQT